MKITVAETAGFCFGVSQAVDQVYRLADEIQDRPVCTLGPIIHNERVIEDLASRGVTIASDIDDIPENAVVVIRSHGVPESVIRELESRDITYYNATCPFVEKIHRIVKEASEAGDEIVIIGSADHPEVRGILGWSENGGTVIEKIEEAHDFTPSEPNRRVCVVVQTTFNSKKFQDFVEIFQKKEYNLNVVNTICRATEQRQSEAARISAVSDVVLVIGGADSSNSRKLYEICKQQCESTFFIQTAQALDEISLRGCAALSITAGASTPKTLIQEVLEACQKK